MGMKWTGILAAVVVSIRLIVAIGFLITYLHPANQDISQEMDDEHDDWEGKQEQGGQGGVGAGRGGRGAGRYKKQEVDTETHRALELHLLEINEKEEGGESGGPGLGETVIVCNHEHCLTDVSLHHLWLHFRNVEVWPLS